MNLYAELKRRTFCRGELEKIDVALFADDAVEGQRQRLVSRRRFGDLVVRLDFEDVRERRDAQPVG